MTQSDSFQWEVMASNSLKCRTIDAHSKPVGHMGSSVFYAGKENVVWRVGGTQHQQRKQSQEFSMRYEDIGACPGEESMEGDGGQGPEVKALNVNLQLANCVKPSVLVSGTALKSPSDTVAAA